MRVAFHAVPLPTVSHAVLQAAHYELLWVDPPLSSLKTNIPHGLTLSAVRYAAHVCLPAGRAWVGHGCSVCLSFHTVKGYHSADLRAQDGKILVCAERAVGLLVPHQRLCDPQCSTTAEEGGNAVSRQPLLPPSKPLLFM